MKVYYGNYLGIVISNEDPEYRGRVQVFVPHVMPTLYEGWNKEGKDLVLECIGDNLPNALTSDIRERLVKILPWAEAASPIIGASAPGNLFTNAVQGAVNAVRGAVQSVAEFIQSPTAEPVKVEGGDAQGLINKAKAIPGIGLDYNPDPDSATNSKGKQWGMCARGTTGLDKAAGLIDNNGPSAGFNAASDLAAGGSLFQKQVNGKYKNPYTQGTGVKYFRPAFTVDTTQTFYNSKTGKTNLIGAQVGDSVFSAGGGGNGHAQKIVGIDKNGDQVWVSDNPQQNGFFTKSTEGAYTNHTVYRLNDAGLARYSAAIGGKVDGQQPPSTSSVEGGSASANPAAPNELANKQGAAGSSETAPVPQSNITLGENAGMTGTTGGGGTASTTTASPGMKAALAAIVQGESGFSVKEANTNFYNNLSGPGRNANVVKEYNKNGKDLAAAQAKYGDYGFFQSNDTTEGQAVYNYLKSQGKDEATAQYYRDAITNGKGKGSFSLQDQTQAAVYLFAGDKNLAGTKAALDQLDPNDPNFKQQASDLIMRHKGKWFGIDEGVAAGATDPNSSAFAKINGTELVNAQNVVTAGISTTVVNNTDGNGRTPVINTNDMASGLFAYPNPGAMVWIFFREGNPLYPVYFAASYSAAEWSSAYRGGSPAEAYDSNGGIKGTGTIMKFGASGILEQKRTNLNDPLDSNSSLTLFHQHGSNITFKDGCDFFYSKNNKRDEAENDRFTITRGYKEEWIEGDDSKNVRGNVIIKVGKIDEESLKAAQDLSDFSYELNQIVATAK